MALDSEIAVGFGFLFFFFGRFLSVRNHPLPVAPTGLVAPPYPPVPDGFPPFYPFKHCRRLSIPNALTFFLDEKLLFLFDFPTNHFHSLPLFKVFSTIEGG